MDRGILTEWPAQTANIKTRNVRVARKRAAELDARLQGRNVPFCQAVKNRVMIDQATADFLAFKVTEGLRPKSRDKYEGLLKFLSAFALSEDTNELRQIDLAFLDRFRRFRSTSVGSRTLYNDGRNLKHF